MTDDLTHYMEATSRLSADLTAAQREIERLRGKLSKAERGEWGTPPVAARAFVHKADADELAVKLAQQQARAETAEAERDEEKARGDHLLQQLVSEGDRFVAARDQAEQLRAERDKLREALEFYADATNYTVALKGSGRDRHGVIGGKMDKGQRAREVLASTTRTGPCSS